MNLFAGDLTNWLLVFVRASAMLSLFPIFSAKNIPTPARIALGGLVAFLVSAALPPFSVSGLQFGSLLGLMSLEAAVGLMLGFVARLLFFATDLAGSIAATEMGLNMASAFNPMTEKQVEAPGLMLYYLASVLFLTLDLHHWLLVGFQRTYALLPIGGVHLRAPLLKDMVGFTSNIFVIALQMAAPLVAISFLVSLVFAVLSRAVPQMNVFSESFAFRALVGLAIFGLTLHLMAEHIVKFLHRLPEDFLRVAQALGTG